MRRLRSSSYFALGVSACAAGRCVSAGASPEAFRAPPGGLWGWKGWSVCPSLALQAGVDVAAVHEARVGIPQPRHHRRRIDFCLVQGRGFGRD